MQYGPLRTPVSGTRQWILEAFLKRELWILAVLGSLMLGCGPDWREFSSPQGEFSLLMPGVPIKGMGVVHTPLGPLEGHTYSVEQQEARYTVGYADCPQSFIQEDRPDLILNTVHEGVNGTLLNERVLSLQDHPGRQLIIESPDGVITQIRVFLVQNRLYQLAMMTKLERASSRNTQKFFDSFHLLPRVSQVSQDISDSTVGYGMRTTDGKR